jgi:hypothetical protein
MRGAVEHRAVIVGVEYLKVVENTGIETHMYEEERDEKQTRQRHYDFSTYCGSEELRPFHKVSEGVEKFDAKVSPDSQKTEYPVK